MEREGVGVAVLSLSCIWMGIAYCGLGLILFFLRLFIFRQNSLQREYWRCSWTGWVCPAAPAVHTRLCSVTIAGIQSSQPPSPCAAGELRCACEVSPVQLCPSLRDGRTAGSVYCVCHFSSSGTVKRPSPASQGGWHLLIKSKGSFWISMIFYIQIANTIADLV